MTGLARSYVHGASDTPLIGETLGGHFVRTAARWAEREALVAVHQGVRWTYAELALRVERFAAGLLAAGMAPGDRLGIWAPNCAEWAVAQLAAHRIGLVLVNVNPAYRPAELEYALAKVECKGLIAAVAFKSSRYLEMLAELAPEIADSAPGALRTERLAHLRLVVSIGDSGLPGVRSFDEVMAEGAARGTEAVGRAAAGLQFDDPANIQFTSGTTGAPKGATLTHHNILNNGFFVGESLRMTERDRVCIPVPLYHCFGMVMGNLACISHGAAMVYPGAAFEPGAVLAAVQAERCTALYGVPTMFIAELDHPGFAAFDMGSLRTGIMAGSPCPMEVMKRVVDEMRMSEVTIAYGMTETSPVSFMTSIGDDLERRVSTVGRVHPHVEVKIVDRAGAVVRPGESGELCTRGYSVMRGYWNDAERTAEAVDAAGWMRTGDLATLDEQGYARIVGRIKDMVIRGGENVYPREVEEYLYRHPKIADVQVIGVPDRRYGEELCAWVRLRDGETATEDEIRSFCEGRIAHFKIPRYVRFVDGFPMTVTGKVRKFVMRDETVKALGLEAESRA